MKTVIILFLSVVLACQAVTDDEVTRQWKSFQEKNKKTYRSPVEASKRLAIFKDNLNRIEAHNVLYDQGKVTHKLGVTPFTDLTTEEFSQYINKFKFAPEMRNERVFKANPNYTAPLEIDWREKGAVRYVRDQGDCGASWSFSAVGALEAQAYIKEGKPLVLSEQNLIDCSGAIYKNYGCVYGNMPGAFDYAYLEGIDSEEDYPYQGVEGVCNPKQIVFKTSFYWWVHKDEVSLQQAVAQIGPISVKIQGTYDLQNYESGIFSGRSCGGGEPNLGVLVVGYGNEDGTDYWIIKNSWGPNWGEAGYLRILRGNGACGITESASYPIV